MVIVAILALIIAFAIAAWITRSVTSGVRVLLGHVGEIDSTSTAELRRGLQALAQGDLTQEIHAPAPRIEDPAGDEIGQLGAPLQRARRGHRRLAGVLRIHAPRAQRPAVRRLRVG
jgi:methyl-accepting chemotaxis protein